MEPAAGGWFIVDSTRFPRQQRQRQTPAPAAPDEPDWLVQAKAGSQHPCCSWYALHQTAVYRLAYLLLGEPADAEDVPRESVCTRLSGSGSLLTPPAAAPLAAANHAQLRPTTAAAQRGAMGQPERF
ncbi:MAG: hypothetical protein H6661_06990 [Ardenticatenaceae bacterium]|nr:hypothetical protein [Ardenticatenaceae bacterium]